MYDLDLIVYDIVAQHKVPTNISDLYSVDLIKALILGGSIKEAAYFLDKTDSSLEHIIRRKLLPVLPKPDKFKWDNYLLSLIELKKCRTCKRILDLDSYGISNTLHFSISSVCLACDLARSKKFYSTNTGACQIRSKEHYLVNKSDYLARNAGRRALKLKATPSWADTEKIKQIYKDCPKGYHVDHIVPLQGVNVCGLHVEYNLQYLTAVENLQKSNKFGE